MEISTKPKHKYFELFKVLNKGINKSSNDIVTATFKDVTDEDLLAKAIKNKGRLKRIKNYLNERAIR